MNRLKELRKSKGLSQVELAKKTGISNQAISFYEQEKRHPKIETWQKLADYFNVSVPYAKGDIDKKLVSKIAKMVFLIETTPFVTDCGFTNNAYESSKMVCSLMMLLIDQLGLNCNDEYHEIILNAQKIFNDKKYENVLCEARIAGPADLKKTKQCIEHISCISDKSNFKRAIKDAKTLINFYDNL